MTEDEALQLIKAALEEVSEGSSDDITMDTHLSDDDVLDSLDLVNFLFELEQKNGSKIEEITETFDDFRIATLVGLLASSSG